MSSKFSPAAAQRAQRLAQLLKTLRQQVTEPVASQTGYSLPPLPKRKLAMLLDVSPTLITKYERAEIDPLDISWSIANRLAEVLGLSLEELKAILVAPQDLSSQTLKLVPNRRRQRLA